jgi:hypothetical protein
LETIISPARRDKMYLPSTQIQSLTLELAQALVALHSSTIIHRSLKPTNIFLDEKNHIIIGDFGLTSSKKEDYQSPEMKSTKQKYNEKSDIWSLGCILYDITSLKHVNMTHELLEAIVDDRLDEWKLELQGDMKRSGLYPEEFVDCVMKMLNRNPNDRPDAKRVLEIDFTRKRSLSDNTPREKTMTLTKRASALIKPQLDAIKEEPKGKLAQDAKMFASNPVSNAKAVWEKPPTPSRKTKIVETIKGAFKPKKKSPLAIEEIFEEKVEETAVEKPEEDEIVETISKDDSLDDLFKKPLVARASSLNQVVPKTPPQKSPSPMASPVVSPRVVRETLDDDLDEIIDRLEENKPSMTECAFETMKSKFNEIHLDQLIDLAQVWGANETVRKAVMRNRGVDTLVLTYICTQLNYNLTLEEWDLRDNPGIDDGAISSLQTLLAKNKTIESLDLRGCGFTEEGKQTLRKSQTKMELLL